MGAYAKLPDDIKELIALVRAGKLFAVQKWIADGKRTVPPEPYQTSPIRVAMQTGFHSMVEVLLTPEVKLEEKNHLLYCAIWDNKYDLAVLLADGGADIKAVDFDDVCYTANPMMMRFFLDRGIDAVTGEPFARALQYPTRPLLGIFMSYRDKIPGLQYQLDLALRHHAREGKLKWVCLLLWAGGNPHLSLPDIGEESDPDWKTSALEEALRRGHVEIVKKMPIDPKQDDLPKLLGAACSGEKWELIETVLNAGADPNRADGESVPIEKLMWNLEWAADSRFGCRSDRRAQAILTAIAQFADRGARWQPENNYRINSLRKSLYHLGANLIEYCIKMFSQHKVCSKDLLVKLIKTPRMKVLMGDRYMNLMALAEGRPVPCRPNSRGR